jgi:acyl-homoserine-lactone acylase
MAVTSAAVYQRILNCRQRRAIGAESDPGAQQSSGAFAFLEAHNNEYAAMKQFFARAALALCCAIAAGCSREPTPQLATPPEPAARAPQYQATIRWTSYGIPHIRATDWGGIGYGLAYAVATDSLCTLAREFVTARGEQSKFFGPGDGRREADIFHRSIITDEAIANARKRLPPEIVALQAGYVAGYNRYLEERAPNASCRGQSWVRPIDASDLARINIGVGVRYGLGRAIAAIANAAPPATAERTQADDRVASMLASGDGSRDGTTPDDNVFGSNAIALGKDATATGRGLLLGNPHYPWAGASRFHVVHLTIPGTLDLMGVGLITTQFVSIGFNHDVAWSHTVSTALRYTLYELELDPNNALRYRYGNDMRKLTSRVIRIEVKDPEGHVVGEEHTVYDSHVGPVVEDRELPWTREHAFALRDSNLGNDRASEQYLKLGQAKSVDEVLAALQSSQGIAWVNTIAADRNGKALYADLSVVPNVDDALIRQCAAGNLERWKDAPVVILRGAPDCEWRVDPHAQQAGILPPSQLPHLVRDDYVTNSNDSYWLANPAAPLEGYSPIVGAERTARTLRTRAGLVFVNEVLGKGFRFDAARLQSLLFNQRNYGAEILLDDVLAICKRGPTKVALDGQTVDVANACKVLRAWDRHEALQSQGAQVWNELWPLAEKTPNLWVKPFDPRDPVHTPRGIRKDDAHVRAAVLHALAQSVKKLTDAHIALDAPWGEVQFVERGGKRIGIPGGPGPAGMFSVMSAPLRADRGYTPITSGNSWIQVVTWTNDGAVDARGVLTYSQSEESDSPHFADFTELYSKGEWLKLPFTDEEISADPNLATLELRGN